MTQRRNKICSVGILTLITSVGGIAFFGTGRCNRLYSNVVMLQCVDFFGVRIAAVFTSIGLFALLIVSGCDGYNTIIVMASFCNLITVVRITACAGISGITCCSTGGCGYSCLVIVALCVNGLSVGIIADATGKGLNASLCTGGLGSHFNSVSMTLCRSYVTGVAIATLGASVSGVAAVYAIRCGYGCLVIVIGRSKLCTAKSSITTVTGLIRTPTALFTSGGLALMINVIVTECLYDFLINCFVTYSTSIATETIRSTGRSLDNHFLTGLVTRSNPLESTVITAITGTGIGKDTVLSTGSRSSDLTIIHSMAQCIHRLRHSYIGAALSANFTGGRTLFSTGRSHRRNNLILMACLNHIAVFGIETTGVCTLVNGITISITSCFDNLINDSIVMTGHGFGHSPLIGAVLTGIVTDIGSRTGLIGLNRRLEILMLTLIITGAALTGFIKCMASLLI